MMVISIPEDMDYLIQDWSDWMQSIGLDVCIRRHEHTGYERLFPRILVTNRAGLAFMNDLDDEDRPERRALDPNMVIDATSMVTKIEGHAKPSEDDEPAVYESVDVNEYAFIDHEHRKDRHVNAGLIRRWYKDERFMPERSTVKDHLRHAVLRYNADEDLDDWDDDLVSQRKPYVLRW
jgi:hypothetical protein